MPAKRFTGAHLIETVVQLLTLIFNEPLEKTEVIICLEGDGRNRISHTVDLYKQGWAKQIVVSGGLNKPPFSRPAWQMGKLLIKKGVPASKIIVESNSQNTYEQAKEVINLAKKQKWSKIILVASAFHQLRAFLTFIKVMDKENYKIKIINSPAINLPWFKKTSLEKNRFELIKSELQKIGSYQETEHAASFEEGIAYEKWKEE